MAKLELAGKRILVAFLMHLGDLILTTPFIYALRQAAPDAHITFLADEKLKDVVLHNPYLDEVITIDKKGRDNSVLALMACARRLSHMDFDILINLHPNERCSFICALTKVKVRAGTCHRLFQPLWDRYTPLDRRKHAADMYLDVLAQLGVEDLSNQGLQIFPGEEHLRQAADYWRNHGIFRSDRLIGFNIGSAVVTKRWAPQRFAAVADSLAQEGYRTVFFGGTMDEEVVKEAVSYMHSTPIVSSGSFTLGTLAAAMRRCCLLITNDSGPMHVAISQQVPVAALYGPSHPDLYGPYTERAVVITAQPPCQGCAAGMKHRCDDMQCMERLTVEQVLAAAHQLLQRYGQGHYA